MWADIHSLLPLSHSLLVAAALKQMESLRIKKGALISKNAVANDTADSPLSQILSKYNLDHSAWDKLSHFVLRLAYCKVSASASAAAADPHSRVLRISSC